MPTWFPHHQTWVRGVPRTRCQARRRLGVFSGKVLWRAAPPRAAEGAERRRTCTSHSSPRHTTVRNRPAHSPSPHRPMPYPPRLATKCSHVPLPALRAGSARRLLPARGAAEERVEADEGLLERQAVLALAVGLEALQRLLASRGAAAARLLSRAAGATGNCALPVSPRSSRPRFARVRKTFCSKLGHGRPAVPVEDAEEAEVAL